MISVEKTKEDYPFISDRLRDMEKIESDISSSVNSGVGVLFRHHRSMNNRRLHRANSFIRARKERAGNLLKKELVTKLQRCANKPD